MLPAGDGEEGFDDVLAHMPLKLQAHVHTVRYIKDRLKAAFAVLKFCRGKEAWSYYHVLAAGVATTPVDERDRHGLMRDLAHAGYSAKAGLGPHQAAESAERLGRSPDT